MGSQAHTSLGPEEQGGEGGTGILGLSVGVTPLVPSCPTAEPVRQRSGGSGASAVANSPILHLLLGCHVGQAARAPAT